MNKVILIGRLTKDPVLTVVSSGVNVCKFTLAVDRAFKDASGNKQTDFLNIVVWRAQADNCAKYLRKGSQCAVFGSIQTRTYEDKNKETRYATDINADSVEFLSRASGDGQSNINESSSESGIDSLQPIDDDVLPF